MKSNRLLPRPVTTTSIFCGALLCLISLLNTAQAQSSNTLEAQEMPPATTAAQIEPAFLWPDLAPGETDRKPGTTRPLRPNEKSPVNRIADISAPSIRAYIADKPNGTAVVILPGGGFSIVCDNKEGTEAAPIFNPQGTSVFVVNYRVSGDRSNQAWKKPVQDAQRAIRYVRHHADKFGVDPRKIGIMGFSAGGQAATVTATATQPYYEAVDEIDRQPFAPNFAILVYPWKLEDKSGQLRPMITIGKSTPPTMIVHSHDDKTASPAAVARLYATLKEAGVESELHIFASGGHGFGFRPSKNSNADSWPNLAIQWIDGLKMTKTGDAKP